MEFDPQSEQEIKSKMCWPPGEYDFEIVKGEDTTSKKGNSMIALELRVFHPEREHPKVLRDWLVGAMELKLNRFCRAVGLFDEYQSGQLTGFACEGRSGRLKLTVEPNAEYGDRNAVKDYIPVGEVSSKNGEVVQGVPASQTKAALARDNGLSEDDIPF